MARATQGEGGNIRITVDNLITSPDSVIDASADTGIDGTVVISTPDCRPGSWCWRAPCSMPPRVCGNAAPPGATLAPAASPGSAAAACRRPGRPAGRRLSRASWDRRRDAGAGGLRTARPGAPAVGSWRSGRAMRDMAGDEFALDAVLRTRFTARKPPGSQPVLRKKSRRELGHRIEGRAPICCGHYAGSGASW